MFLKSARAEGKSPEESGIEATRTRFQAVMITSLTTVAGLMPLLIERSLQTQILIPIATSICFGLMASTILVLLVIPPFYVILNGEELNDVDQFYAELDELVAKRHVEVERPDSKTVTIKPRNK